MVSEVDTEKNKCYSLRGSDAKYSVIVFEVHNNAKYSVIVFKVHNNAKYSVIVSEVDNAKYSVIVFACVRIQRYEHTLQK